MGRGEVHLGIREVKMSSGEVWVGRGEVQMDREEFIRVGGDYQVG